MPLANGDDFQLQPARGHHIPDWVAAMALHALSKSLPTDATEGLAAIRERQILLQALERQHSCKDEVLLDMLTWSLLHVVGVRCMW